MPEKLFVLSRQSGQVLYHRQYSGAPLNLSLVTAFFSSISSFTKSLISQSLDSVVLDQSRFVYRELGDALILVAYCSKQEPPSVIARALADLEVLLAFLFGPPDQWTDDFFLLAGEYSSTPQPNNSNSVTPGSPGARRGRPASNLAGPPVPPSLRSGTPSVRSVVDGYPRQDPADAAGSGAGTGLDDLVDAVFSNLQTELSAAVAGLESVIMDAQDTESVDQLLSDLERFEDITGSLLLLSGAESTPLKVLASRLPLMESRMIVHFAQCRPLEPSVNLTLTPVHTHGRWYHLLLRSIPSVPSIVLAALVTVSAGLEALQPHLDAMDAKIVETGLTLPVEPPPVHVRHFAPREVVAFVYHNSRTGRVVAPELRPGPSMERNATLATFWSSYRAASGLASDSSGITSVTLSCDGYWFHFRQTGIHTLYILFTDQVKHEDVQGLSMDVQQKILASITVS